MEFCLPRAGLVIAASGALLGGCAGEAAQPPNPPPTGAPSSTAGAPSFTPVAAQRVVVLDPGHNGGNGANPAAINRQVPDGRGKTKACNTTGTSARDGYPEHAFNWAVAEQVRDLLTARGLRVVMTRNDDSGVGPCVDERAAIGNRGDAAAVVAIHADGADGAGAHGFHIAYSAPPLNAAQGEPSVRLANTLRDTMVGAGFATSSYVGSAGLDPRADLAGLNLSERPTALVECGNMRDPGDAALLESPDGRARIAAAIAAGITAYLG
ncbi:N-acetylmuramoyl-L-alanine amidase [Nocardia arthritidis]|uniref:N-acetylmuramoyl-L-alanine amidase n=1 Tax=Nocardia arthritidis TaxID=228602 RepID=A0A6G9YBU1_9NOCA|nr:N-acetylmuramoyl-L-alanine amidase [Nocardia arthritidis]QIS10526.1 N-acetylmuramoyl-L-alanine amidase [Nocardia arthritidis]